MQLSLQTLVRELFVLMGMCALLSQPFLLQGVQTVFAISARPPTDWVTTCWPGSFS